MINTLKGIIEERDYTSENEKIDHGLISTTKVRKFYGKGNEELKYERDFEMNCIVLSEYTNEPVKECTVKEYFTLLKFLDKKQERGRQSHQTR